MHLGGGVSGHIKLIGGRFFDWVAAGKRVYTDTSWSVGFAPRWLAAEIERRGVGHDRVLFASDEPWFADAQADCRFMHCLPVRRGVVVADRILDGPRSVVIQEARNRMVAQMAVLYRMMKG